MTSTITPLTRGQIITVRGFAPEGEERWSFTAEALTDAGDELILRVREGESVSGPEPWVWPAAGDLHLWRSRPYSILVTTRARRFSYWYCPIHTPANLQSDEICVTDLGVDVQLFADGRYSVGGEAPDPTRYPELAALSAAAVDELIGLMERKAPPFDGRTMPDAD